MVTFLRVDPERKNWLDDRQYDFRSAQGTEDAVNSLIDRVRESPRMYGMKVFQDIDDSFNAVQKDHMLDRCSVTLLYRDYFWDRSAQITVN